MFPNSDIHTAPASIEMFWEGLPSKLRQDGILFAAHVAYCGVYTSDLLYYIWYNFRNKLDQDKPFSLVLIADVFHAGFGKKIDNDTCVMEKKAASWFRKELVDFCGLAYIKRLRQFNLEYANRVHSSKDQPYLKDIYLANALGDEYQLQRLSQTGAKSTDFQLRFIDLLDHSLEYSDKIDKQYLANQLIRSEEELPGKSALPSYIVKKIAGVHSRQYPNKSKKDALKRRFSPYITGPPIRHPKDFFGRREIVQPILNQIHNNHFLIIGERRIGKTSLLFHLEYQIKSNSDEEYIFYPVYMDLEKTKDEELWRHLADTIQVVDGKIHSRKDLDYGFDDFKADLKTLLHRLRNAHKDQKIRIVLLMDEIDVLSKYSEGTLSKMRNIFQENYELKVIMAGVGIRNIAEDINSAWYNQLYLIELGVMNQEQARQLIIQPVAPVYNYTEHAIEKIIHLSKCKPLIIQQLCSRAVETMLSRIDFKKSNEFIIDVEDVKDHKDNLIPDPIVKRSSRNPYISGPRITERENFYDRNAVMEELSHQDSMAYFLKGNRRIGKSSLLLQLYNQINATEKKHIAILLNLEGCENESDSINRLLRGLNEAEHLKDVSLSRMITPRQNDLVTLLRQLIKAAKDIGLHVFLLVDEAESLMKLPERTLKLLHPELVNLHDNLKVILTATRQLYKLNHAAVGDTPFLSNFFIRHISCFDETISEHLIRQTQLAVEKQPQVEDEEVNEIIRLCGGHPYLTQFLCRNLFNQGKLRMPEQKDVLLDQLIADYIRMDFDHLEPKEKDALKFFNFHKAKFLSDIPRECRNHIKGLLHLGFLIEENDQYRLSNCFLSQWLEQHEDKEVEPLIIEQPKPKPKKIFLSYSKSDTEWKNKLKKQLRIYERNAQLTIWDDSLILPGQSWSKEIELALATADIVLFLVSADLMATDYVMDTELPTALSRQQQGQTTIIPVIMRPCQWTVSAFGALQAVPNKGTPVSTYSNEDEALNEVVARIAGLL